MATKNDSLFLITGATGNTGDTTVRLLLQRGHHVRAFVHRSDARSESLAAAGAEIVVGDLLDFHAVSNAMQGATGAYFCYPIAPGLLDATVIFAQAASEAGVKAVVNMSQISARREAKSDAARQHWLGERLLDRTTMQTAHLRPTFFTEWLTWYWNYRGDEGVLRLPLGNGRHAPIAGKDQSYVIAAILENPEPHDRQIYPLHGPVEMNYNEIASTIAQTLAIPVRYEPIDVATFVAGLNAKGFPSHLVQHLSNVAIDYQNGIFAGTNNFVEVIGNKTPMTVEDYVNANKEAFSKDGSYAIATTPTYALNT
ncbi:NAD(P)H-binding protein [Nostoc sp. NMS8]|uniref:NmrA family NAD(P)-binding protein n=1 Tax=Nostoc sp. NMS8 TaxID=2815392 RepID=UPI0025DEF0B9|nr:NAD(P)H-binding protein [Nostoc sp. NMS8]MBN3957433.1 NAD(P)H-binding protein [Nostoc sp. NMS8]